MLKALRFIAKRKIIKIIIVLVVMFVVFALLTGNIAYRKWGYMCQNTGSQKGHAKWFFGSVTDEWYKKSELEQFIADKHPDKLEYDWVSYMGTGYDFFGTARLRGHGRPANYSFSLEFFEKYMSVIDDDEKMKLYELFRTHDKLKIEKETQKVMDVLWQHRAKFNVPAHDAK